jgi:hypothetical protein
MALGCKAKFNLFCFMDLLHGSLHGFAAGQDYKRRSKEEITKR